MTKQSEQGHFYILPSGEFVKNQKEGCIKLEIGRNAFRNMVKNEIIKKLHLNRPNGYEQKETNLSY